MQIMRKVCKRKILNSTTVEQVSKPRKISNYEH